MSPTTFELKRGPWRLAVDPQLGGSVLGFWHGTTAILRETPAGTTRAGATAAYPLLPYSNRVGQGRMTWRGETHALRNGFDAGPHALHGVGFMHAWQVAQQSPVQVVLQYAHYPDAYWPFAFEAELEFELDGEGLRVQMRLRSTDPRPQPAGLGWHPFFVRRSSATVDLPVQTQWESGADKLPIRERAVDGMRGAVETMRYDHCFVGAKQAVLADDTLTVELVSSSPYWVVYTPEGADFYCVEPVTHMNNAVQQPDPLACGLVELFNGQSIALDVRCRVSLR